MAIGDTCKERTVRSIYDTENDNRVKGGFYLLLHTPPPPSASAKTLYMEATRETNSISGNVYDQSRKLDSNSSRWDRATENTPDLLASVIF